MAGRPTKTKDEAMSMNVRIRVTPAERAEILRRAKAAKARNESTWIRERLLGGK
jgi:hypothetical protein